MTSSSQEHGSPAEIKPDSTICTQGKNERHSSIHQTLFKSTENLCIDILLQKLSRIGDWGGSVLDAIQHSRDQQRGDTT
jgi:hypothetical protein